MHKVHKNNKDDVIYQMTERITFALHNIFY